MDGRGRGTGEADVEYFKVMEVGVMLINHDTCGKQVGDKLSNIRISDIYPDTKAPCCTEYSSSHYHKS